MNMFIKNIRKVDGEWYATLLDDNKEISIIFQEGGGNCTWTAYNIEDLKQMWAVQGVYKEAPNIEDWGAGDKIELCNAINPDNK